MSHVLVLDEPLKYKGHQGYHYLPEDVPTGETMFAAYPDRVKRILPEDDERRFAELHRQHLVDLEERRQMQKVEQNRRKREQNKRKRENAEKVEEGCMGEDAAIQASLGKNMALDDVTRDLRVRVTELERQLAMVLERFESCSKAMRN
jgi:hypothetical protein